MEWRRRSICVALLFMGFNIVSAQWSNLKKIKESNLEVLTFQEGKYTTARRTSPIPQLRCVSGCSHTPKTVQCYNRGWDGQGNNWECKAALPVGVSFGQMDVNCEGFDYSDDPYITVGSCSLKYELVGQSAHRGSSKGGYNNDGKGGVIFNVLFYMVLFTIIVALYKSCMRSMRYGPGSGDESGPWGPGGQGYYGTGGPPPGGPGFRPDFYPPGDGCGGTRRMGPPPGQGPGFWSGAMAGGLLGYLFGNRGDAYGYGGNYDYARRQRHYPDMDPFTRSGPTNSSWTSSSDTREGTGFATSSRR